LLKSWANPAGELAEAFQALGLVELGFEAFPVGGGLEPFVCGLGPRSGR